MADTTTRKLLIDVEARYASVDQALRRIADLSVEIQTLRNLRKEEGQATEANKATLASLNTALKAAQKEYNQLNGYVAANVASARAFETAMGGVDDTLLSVRAQLGKASAAWSGLTAAQRSSESGQALKARIEALTKTLYDNETQLNKNKITVGNYAGEIEGLLTKMSREGNVVGVTSQAYSELLTKYQMAEAKARQYVLVLGEQSDEAMGAVADLKRLGAELDKLNTTMGKYQSKTFNASYATFSLSQVVRELPNFAIDARLGFMALSNNLPMLADDFNRLKKELGSSGKALAAFGKSLLGVNTVMVLLSTVLIAWGPQIINWIKGLFNANRATKTFESSASQLNKAMREGAKNAQSEASKLELMYEATQSANVPMEERRKLVGELQKMYPDYLGNISTEAFLAGKAKDAYLLLADSLLKTAVAQKLADSYAENRVKIIELETELTKERDKLESERLKKEGLRLRQQEEGTRDRTGEFTPQATDISTARQLASAEKQYEATAFAVSELEAEIANLDETNQVLKKNILSTDLIGFLTGGTSGKQGSLPEEDRAAMLRRLLDLDTDYRESVIKAEKGYQSTDFDSKLAYEARLFQLKDESERKKLSLLLEYGQLTRAEYDKQLSTLDNQQVEFSNKQMAATEDRMRESKNKLLKLLGDTEQIELEETAKLYDETLSAYEASLGDKSKLNGEQIYEMLNFELMVEEQKQQALAGIRAEYRDKQAKMNRASILKEYADELSLAGKGITERYSITKARIDGEIALLEAKYGKEATMSERDSERYRRLLEERTDNDKAYEENRIAVKEEFMDKALELATAMSDIVDALGERETQRAEERHTKESESLKSQYERGLISKRGYDAQQLLLDKSLDAEKAKIARAQAIRERALATFSIGINTAKAIMGIWAEFPKYDFGISAGLATGIVTALGLAQAAAVWAAPLPKASKGLLLHGPSHAGGGVPIEAEGGEAIINARSTTLFKPLLSAINQAGGGVRFAAGGVAGLANDGGFSARQAERGGFFITADDIAQAMKQIKISVAVEQIEKARGKYVEVVGRATY